MVTSSSRISFHGVCRHYFLSPSAVIKFTDACDSFILSVSVSQFYGRILLKRSLSRAVLSMLIYKIDHKSRALIGYHIYIIYIYKKGIVYVSYSIVLYTVYVSYSRLL